MSAEYVYKLPDALDPQQTLLCKIAYATDILAGLIPGGGGGGGLNPSYNPTFVSMSASASQVIPATASYSFIVLTGTGTIGGVAAPLLAPISGDKLAAPLTVTTGSASTAFLAYQVPTA